MIYCQTIEFFVYLQISYSETVAVAPNNMQDPAVIWTAFSLCL